VGRVGSRERPQFRTQGLNGLAGRANSTLLPSITAYSAPCAPRAGLLLCGLWLEQRLDRAVQHEPAPADQNRLQLSIGEQLIDR
jgi:hypothetical protein